MASNTKHPAHALVVRNYDEFRKIIRAHVQGHYELVTVVGPPGVGKSQIISREMQATHGPGRWGAITGKITPLELYRRLFQYRLHPLVLDDLDGLFSKPDNTALLKAVCDTKPLKRVEWRSSHVGLGADLPKGFDSISRICLIANTLDVVNKNVGAIQDRGILVLFQPTVAEVHAEVANGGWFDDAEVFSFIGQHLHLMLEPSIRFYSIAREHKCAGLDWRDITLRSIESAVDPSLLLVAKLLADPEYDQHVAPETAREQAFRLQGGKSRATFFRHKQALLAARGAIDHQAISNVKLGPQKIDLCRLAQLEHRQHLEAIRDETPDNDASSTNESNKAPLEPNDHGLSNKMIDQLERDLRKAVSRQDYEQAARLRDDIRRLRNADGDEK